MTAQKCRRGWEVEAARDGRLAGSALRSFEDHLRTCESCAREARSLDAVLRELRAQTKSDATEDQVSLRRDRERLLERADVALRRRPAAPLLSRRHAVMAALLFGAVAFGVVALRRAPAALPPLASVRASADAKWERRRTDHGERIDLWTGGLDVEVTRSPSDPPFSVHVPDGEILDEGTTFRVTVRDGRTAELAVQAGAVVFRRDGQVDVRVTSGTVWSPSALASTHAVEPVPSPANTAAVLDAGTRKLAPHASAHHAPVTPLDEDVAYLRIVALRREGRAEEARLAAAEYLRKFPKGFRRAEVVKFSEATGPH